MLAEASIRPHSLRQAVTAAPTPAAFVLPRPGWVVAGIAALLFSSVGWASMPRPSGVVSDSDHQWQALGIGALAGGGRTGMRMESTDSVQPVEIAPARVGAVTSGLLPKPAVAAVADDSQQRIRGRVGSGFYWALRAAGASPVAAAQYLAALATRIDVGDVQPTDSFDLVVDRASAGRTLLYAGFDRQSGDLQLVRWGAGAAASWIDAGNAGQPAAQPSEGGGMMMPAAGRITSFFGNRYHPILHFTRFHAGIDIGASWGSPIVAAADGQVVGAGWAGGYGRQVRVAHSGELVSSYSHMSEIAVAPGTFVRRGQVIGYVGSSGLSTGPHVHFEVKEAGVPVNPLSVRLVSAPPAVDTQLAGAVKARLQTLLKVGTKAGA